MTEKAPYLKSEIRNVALELLEIRGNGNHGSWWWKARVELGGSTKTFFVKYMPKRIRYQRVSMANPVADVGVPDGLFEDFDQFVKAYAEKRRITLWHDHKHRRQMLSGLCSILVERDILPPDDVVAEVATYLTAYLKAPENMAFCQSRTPKWSFGTDYMGMAFMSLYPVAEG